MAEVRETRARAISRGLLKCKFPNLENVEKIDDSKKGGGLGRVATPPIDAWGRVAPPTFKRG